MADLKLEGAPKTPTIEFNTGNGYLLIRGRSIPENSISLSPLQYFKICSVEWIRWALKQTFGLPIGIPK